MNNETAITNSNSSSALPQPTAIQPASVSAEDIRHASIEKLNALYSESVTKSAALVQSMIGIGECVVEILNSCAASGGVFSNPKKAWGLLECGGKIPFGWVQALRYKKIYEQRDALQAKFQELGINLTVEKAYRLLGGLDEKAELAKKKEAVPFVGTVFGVDSQMLVKRRSELAHDIEASKSELNQLVEKLKGLEELDSAYTYVQSFLAQPNLLVRRPTSLAKIIRPFSKVSAENEAVEGFYRIIQMCAQCYNGSVPDSGLSQERCEEYRVWLITTLAGDQSQLLIKLEEFVRNPAKAMSESSGFEEHYAQILIIKNEAKQKRAAEEKAYRDAERAALARARKEFQMNFRRIPVAN